MENLLFVAVGILLAVACWSTFRWWISRKLRSDEFVRDAFIQMVVSDSSASITGMEDAELMNGVDDPHGFGYGVALSLQKSWADLEPEVVEEIAQLVWDEVYLEAHRRGLLSRLVTEGDSSSE